MQKIKAQLSNHRQSPRKVRVVADLVRGKTLSEALDTLAYTTKRAAGPVEKLLLSAAASAKNLSIPTDGLVVKEIKVDGGKTLFRRRPMSRGRAFVIRKRTSHVSLTLEESAPKAKKVRTTKKTVEK